VEVVVEVVVVVVVVEVVVVVVVVVVVLVEVLEVVLLLDTNGQIFQPWLVMDPSDSHDISPLGTSPSGGPFEPENALPFTTSSSYLASVSKETTVNGTSCRTMIVHFSLEP
jgi:hypothetical protein